MAFNWIFDAKHSGFLVDVDPFCMFQLTWVDQLMEPELGHTILEPEKESELTEVIKQYS